MPEKSRTNTQEKSWEIMPPIHVKKICRKLTANFIPLFLFVLFCISPVFGDGVIIPRPLPDMLQPPNLTIKYHRVKVTVQDQVATTEVDQVFVNDINRDLEGDYIFPLPEGSAISSFSMDVDGKMVEGKILEKDEARAIYEEIVRRRKDPALLEYVGRNIIRIRVYPIPAKGEKRIKLKYTETLKADNGLVKYVYPLSTEKFSAKDLKEVTVNIDIKSKVAIKTFYSPSHEMAISRNSDHHVKASFEKTGYKPDKDLITYYTLSDKDFGLNLLTYREKGEKEGYFIMFLAPREKTEKGEVLPKDVVFVIDNSGSMDDDNKMESAIKALKFCLSNLNAKDRFNIVVFSDEIRSFSKEGLLTATADNIKKAREFADGIKPLGATDINTALSTGLKLFTTGENTRYLIFLTDGLPTAGVTEVPEIVKNIAKQNTKKVKIFTFGVGNDVNTNLLDTIADENRGYPEYIKPGEETEIKISSFYKKISEPLLSDVSLNISNVQTESVYPKIIPDIFKGTQLMVVGKFTGSGPSRITLSGKKGSAPLENTYEGNFPAISTDNEFIPYVWAVRRIGYLLETVKIKGENKELVTEIVHLSRKYGIITPYTSFLVTEPAEKKYGVDDHRPAPVRSSAPSGPMMKGGARDESGEESVKSSKDIQQYKQSEGYMPTPTSESELGSSVSKVKRIKDKTFYLQGEIWTDADYQGTEQIIKIKFGSDEYFNLIKDKQLALYLSAGNQVMVKYQNKVYQIQP